MHILTLVSLFFDYNLEINTPQKENSKKMFFNFFNSEVGIYVSTNVFLQVIVDIKITFLFSLNIFLSMVLVIIRAN